MYSIFFFGNTLCFPSIQVFLAFLLNSIFSVQDNLNALIVLRNVNSTVDHADIGASSVLQSVSTQRIFMV